MKLKVELNKFNQCFESFIACMNLTKTKNNLGR